MARNIFDAYAEEVTQRKIDFMREQEQEDYAEDLAERISHYNQRETERYAPRTQGRDMSLGWGVFCLIMFFFVWMMFKGM